MTQAKKRRIRIPRLFFRRLFVGYVLAFFVGAFVFCYLELTHQSSKTAEYLFLGVTVVGAIPVVGGFVLEQIALHRIALRQRTELAALLGLQQLENLSDDQSRNALAQISHIQELQKKQSSVKWCISGTVNDRSTFIMQHQHWVLAGHTRRTYKHIVAGAACPKDWPALTLSHRAIPLQALHRAWHRLTGTGLQFESEEFTQRCRVKCESQDFSLCFLIPEVQQYLVNGPKENWHLYDGFLCCVRKITDQPALADILRRPIEVVAMVEKSSRAN